MRTTGLTVSLAAAMCLLSGHQTQAHQTHHPLKRYEDWTHNLDWDVVSPELQNFLEAIGEKKIDLNKRSETMLEHLFHQIKKRLMQVEEVEDPETLEQHMAHHSALTSEEDQVHRGKIVPSVEMISIPNPKLINPALIKMMYDNALDEEMANY